MIVGKHRLPTSPGSGASRTQTGRFDIHPFTDSERTRTLGSRERTALEGRDSHRVTIDPSDRPAAKGHITRQTESNI